MVYWAPMAHQSLYRAYRPQTFAEIVGQDQVIAPLVEQIKAGKVGHAFLFAGSRGLGKTSIARIFARELKTSDRDLYEIDAASHNGVDYIRELTENIYTLPFESPYKVYILDEAHMLSKGAWNAFLKTLEEPPAHALFILATTEREKIPETVESRCQVYEFKKPSRAVLAKTVTDIAKKEGYALAPAAAELVALLGDGSYRDALSVLEKVLASSAGKEVTAEDAERATGAPKHALVLTLLTALSAKDVAGALAAIRTAADSGIDMPLYLTLALEGMRNALLIRHAPELKNVLMEELGSDRYEELAALVGITHETLRTFLDAASRIRYSPVPSLPLELAVLELAGHAGEE